MQIRSSVRGHVPEEDDGVRDRPTCRTCSSEAFVSVERLWTEARCWSCQAAIRDKKFWLMPISGIDNPASLPTKHMTAARTAFLLQKFAVVASRLSLLAQRGWIARKQMKNVRRVMNKSDTSTLRALLFATRASEGTAMTCRAMRS